MRRHYYSAALVTRRFLESRIVIERALLQVRMWGFAIPAVRDGSIFHERSGMLSIFE